MKQMAAELVREGCQASSPGHWEEVHVQIVPDSRLCVVVQCGGERFIAKSNRDMATKVIREGCQASSLRHWKEVHVQIVPDSRLCVVVQCKGERLLGNRQVTEEHGDGSDAQGLSSLKP
jgi:hypothetical protein